MTVVLVYTTPPPPPPPPPTSPPRVRCQTVVLVEWQLQQQHCYLLVCVWCALAVQRLAVDHYHEGSVRLNLPTLHSWRPGVRAVLQ